MQRTRIFPAPNLRTKTVTSAIKDPYASPSRILLPPALPKSVSHPFLFLYASLNDILLVSHVCGLYISGFFTHYCVCKIHSYWRGSCGSYYFVVTPLQKSIEMYPLWVSISHVFSLGLL